MGKSFLIILLGVLPHLALSQDGDRAEALFQEITFSEDSLRSGFYWIASNISYDVATMQAGDEGGTRDEILSHVTEHRKGVCVHYAELFHALCRKLGYESYVVGGYTYQLGEMGERPHVWNAVKTDGKWYMYDPTWASGYVDEEGFVPAYDDKWYKVPPEAFIVTHVPDDPVWQFLEYPHVTTANGERGPGAVYYNFEDSARRYADFENDLKLLENSYRRVSAEAGQNRHTKNYLTYLQNRIQCVKYNDVENHLKRGHFHLNRYFDAKEWRFKRPDMEGQEIRAMLDSASMHASRALAILEVTEPTPVYADYAAEMRAVYAKLLKDLHEERAFMDRYERTRKARRKFLFAND